MKLDFGIAFVTGRSHFRDVLRTYFFNWIEHELVNNRNVNLHLFIVYDLDYSDAIREDFRDIPPEISSLLESVNLYGRREIDEERRHLIDRGRISPSEGDLLFGEGYAKKRNAALYFARKEKMHRLLFLDDDEFGGELSFAAGPVGRTAAASTNLTLNSGILTWSMSKGAFIGASLKGAYVEPDNEANQAVYGMNAMSILDNPTRAKVAELPSEVANFSRTVAIYAGNRKTPQP
jgi:hypothetical protein